MTPQPPDCLGCGAPASADHAPNCNFLRAMRAQAYPTILDLNGRAWYENAIAQQRERIALLEAMLRDLRTVMQNP